MDMGTKCTKGYEKGDTGKEMESWLHEKPGVVQVIGALGSRKTDTPLQRWHCKHYGKCLWGSDDGMCCAAAIVHAIDSMRRQHVAMSCMEKMKKIRRVVRNLAVITELVQQMCDQGPAHMNAWVELRWLKKKE